MTTERRWYEPPAPRDWHPTAAELQRLESASSLRKALLDRSSTKGLDRASLQSSSSRKSDLYDFDKSVLESSLRGSLASRAPSSKGVPLARSLSRGVVRPDGDARGLASMPNLPHRASSAGKSVVDLGASYVSKKLREQEDVGRILRSRPPSSTRCSSMAKYEPLPAIMATPTASAMDTNNNKDREFEPPPLIRSRTFDVIDTKMMNLPVVSDSGDGEIGGGDGGVSREMRGTLPHTVTVSIEGKPLTEFLSHARDGLLRSRPGTHYAKSDHGAAGTSSSVAYRDLRTDKTKYEYDTFSESSSDAEGELSLQSETSEGWGGESSSPDGAGGDSRAEHDGAEKDDDIIVYFRLPDDSLLLSSSPRTRTLRELLQVVGNTQVGGRPLAVACDDLNPNDLDRSLAELGVTDNTTLYLLDQ